MSLWSDLERQYGIAILKRKRFRDVYCIVTRNRGTLCLKYYAIPEVEMSFIAQVFTHLTGNGFKYSPRILLTRNHAPWFTRNGVHYMLTNWVKGEKPNFSNLQHYKHAIRRLAKFHTVSQGFPVSLATEARTRYRNIPLQISSYREVLNGFQGTDLLRALCDEATEYLEHPTALRAIEQEEAVLSFTHGDYNYPNLIRHPSGKIYMIDFENTSLSARMQDLAHILYRNFPWRNEKMLQWINYYNLKRSLTPEDRYLLYCLLLVPYPVVREIRLNKSEHFIRSVIPTEDQIRVYKSGLQELLV
jgi:CotS family spore coat protein